MIVGFIITDFKGHEKDAVSFIQRVCILESPDIAWNIVNLGTGINIFSSTISIDELLSQPFDSTPIEIQENEHLLVSAVDFNIELLYNNRVLRLKPTEYIHIEYGEILQFMDAINQGLVKVIPDMNMEGLNWILNEGSWNDDGVWIDSNYWRDSK